MIYWKDVRTELLHHCPQEASNGSGWTLKEIVTFLNKTEGLSMSKIAKLTRGKCGRTALYSKLKQLSP